MIEGLRIAYINWINKRITEDIIKLEGKLTEVDEDKQDRLKTRILYLKNSLVKNKTVLEYHQLPTLEKQDLNTDLSFYKPDTLSYYLVLLAILAEIYYLIRILNIMERTYMLGIVILFNIALLLFLFMGSLKVKVYKKNWGYFFIAVGAYALVRIIYIIPDIIKVTKGYYQNIILNYQDLIAAETSETIIQSYRNYIETYQKSITSITHIIVACVILSILSVLAGIRNILIVQKQIKYKKEGNITFKQMSK